MNRSKYNIAINKNTLECWGIILLVLLVSYAMEVLKGTRTIPYFIIFLIILAVPYLHAIFYNKRNKGLNLKLKYIFVVSYMLLYTFVLLTTKTFVTYVYVIPMVSILIAYCDNKLVFYMFLYVVLVNIFSIILQYNEFVASGSQLVFGMSDRLTMWEIQLALVILSGIFLSKTCLIVKKRDDVLDVLEDDICKDSLTGVYNKKFIEEKIHKMFKSEKTKSLAFIDVDDFKHFNTVYGHTFGDEVLITLCDVIEKHLENFENSYLIRVGGDEFAIFSLDFKTSELKSILDTIVEDVSKTKIPFGKKKVGVNISIGMACTDKDKCRSFIDLYNLADKRNGKAKKNGKNRVEES